MIETTNYSDGEPPAVSESASAVVDTAALVWMIQSKNERGFHILYDRYCSALYGILIKFVRSTDIADDLLQDVFVKIWRYIDSFDPARGTLFTWMLNIARNEAINYLRSARHQQVSMHVDNELYSLHRDYADANASSNNMAELKDLQNKTLQLDAKYAEVIDMIFFCGCTHEQTARILKIPLGTVKTRVRKGLSMLKNIYLQCGMNGL
jgi:RNA polymerase sigma-70 factor, ECF subfamily